MKEQKRSDYIWRVKVKAWDFILKKNMHDCEWQETKNFLILFELTNTHDVC